MEVFKKVVCVDNADVPEQLTLGQVYDVIGEEEELYYLYDGHTASGTYGWYKTRFQDVPEDDSNYLFTLLVPTSSGRVNVRAFQRPTTCSDSHSRLEVEVRLDGKVLFPRGQLYFGVPNHYSVDGTHAKEMALSTVAMKPGDTDADYFSSYTPEQLTFAQNVGEGLQMVAEDRYRDHNGEVRHD